jgi:hypothetical protein
MNAMQDDNAKCAELADPVDDAAAELDECTNHGCAVLLYLCLLGGALVVGAGVLLVRLVKSF